MAAGKRALEPGSYFVSDATAIRRNTNKDGTTNPVEPYHKPNPVIDKKTIALKDKENKKSITSSSSDDKALDDYEYVDESSKKILIVLNKGEKPPQVLLQEAYRSMELMNGNHIPIVREYLDSQDDWDTEVNRKFILDFVSNPNSREFMYILENKPKFINQFGFEQVTKTLEILTYRALYNAVPRPSLEQAIQLYTNLEVDNPKRNAYHYFISRLIVEDNVNEVINLGNEYLKEHAHDHELQFNISRYLTLRANRNTSDLNTAHLLLQKAITNHPNSVFYLDLQGKIYQEMGNPNLAQKMYQKALKNAKEQGISYQPESVNDSF